MKKIKIKVAKANKNIEKYKGKIDNLLSKIHANTTKFEAQYEPYELADAQIFYADYYAEHNEDAVQSKSDSQHNEHVVQDKSSSLYNEHQDAINSLTSAMDKLGLSDMQFRV